MDIKQYDNNLVGIKVTSEERNVLERAAHATVRAIGLEATGAVARAEEAGDTAATEAAKEAKRAANKTIMAIGAVTKRVTDNRPPVYLTPVEEGLAVSVGEEGYTVLDGAEVGVAQDLLQRYADATVDAVEGYQHQGGLNTSASDRAHYGYVADAMAAQLRGSQPTQG